jgi:hypothetical protein
LTGYHPKTLEEKSRQKSEKSRANKELRHDWGEHPTRRGGMEGTGKLTEAAQADISR